MKNLLIVLTLISSQAYAQQKCGPDVLIKEVKEDVNTPTPKQLEGATIIVKMKDGTTKEMKAEEFKIVPRKQQFKVTERRYVDDVSCKINPPVVYIKGDTVVQKHKNILSLEAVRGMTDYGYEVQPGVTTITSKYGYGAGLMYQRNVIGNWYLGGSANTLKGLGLNVGYSF